MPSMISNSFASRALSTQALLAVPFVAATSLLSSAAWNFLASSKICRASFLGITITPSGSAKMMSPGFTLTSPQAIGTLTSPGPSLYGPPGVVPVAYTGKSHLPISSISRIGPSKTMPATFFVWRRYAIMISPIRARVLSPSLETTNTSPS